MDKQEQNGWDSRKDMARLTKMDQGGLESDGKEEEEEEEEE